MTIAALHAAHSAGDRSLGANVLGFMSCQAKDLERYPEAVRLAEAAKVGYPGTSTRVRAILCLRVAEAHAQTGDVDRCRTAIDDGYEALRKTPADSGEPAWSYWLDEAQVNAQAGYCYARLGDWARAQSHLLAALRLQEDSYGREGALRRALLATVNARKGDPERACETAGKAMDILAEDVDSARCLVHIRRVRSALDPYRKIAVVRDFHDRTSHLLGGS